MAPRRILTGTVLEEIGENGQGLVNCSDGKTRRFSAECQRNGTVDYDGNVGIDNEKPTTQIPLPKTGEDIVFFLGRTEEGGIQPIWTRGKQWRLAERMANMPVYRLMVKTCEFDPSESHVAPNDPRWTSFVPHWFGRDLFDGSMKLSLTELFTTNQEYGFRTFADLQVRLPGEGWKHLANPWIVLSDQRWARNILVGNLEDVCRERLEAKQPTSDDLLVGTILGCAPRIKATRVVLAPELAEAV